MAATYIEDNCEKEETLQTCTDSQSLCMALQSYNPRTDPIREILQPAGPRGEDRHIMDTGPLQHSGKRYGRGCKHVGAGQPIRRAKIQIWKTVQDEITHRIMERVYRTFKMESEFLVAKGKTRLQFQSGKH